MHTINDVLFFDVETTGLPEKGQTYEKDFMNFPHIVQLAWSINGVDKDYIIKPEGWEIPADAAKIHGITTEIALVQGVPLKVALQDFLHHAYHSLLICAHNIYFDTSIIKANVLRTMGEEFFSDVEITLHKSKRIDTMYKTIKFVGAKKENGSGKTPTLIELHEKLFPGEKFDAHDAMEDVNALKRCLPKLVELGIIELKLKEYPEEKENERIKVRSITDIQPKDLGDFHKNIVDDLEKPTESRVKEATNLGKSFGLSSQEWKDSFKDIEDNF